MNFMLAARYALAAPITAAVLCMTAIAPADAADSHREWSACEYEDGSGQARCIWHGRRHGNGIGASVKIFNGGEDNMRVVRIKHRLASHLLDRH